jgi:hypothetical protein
MAVLNRKLFNRGGPVSSRGVGITSGLVPRYSHGGPVSEHTSVTDKFADNMEMLKGLDIIPERKPFDRSGANREALMTLFGNLMAGKSYQGGLGGALEIAGKSLTAAAPQFGEALAERRAYEAADPEAPLKQMALQMALKKEDGIEYSDPTEVKIKYDGADETNNALRTFDKKNNVFVYQTPDGEKIDQKQTPFKIIRDTEKTNWSNPTNVKVLLDNNISTDAIRTFNPADNIFSWTIPGKPDKLIPGTFKEIDDSTDTTYKDATDVELIAKGDESGATINSVRVLEGDKFKYINPATNAVLDMSNYDILKDDLSDAEVKDILDGEITYNGKKQKADFVRDTEGSKIIDFRSTIDGKSNPTFGKAVSINTIEGITDFNITPQKEILSLADQIKLIEDTEDAKSKATRANNSAVSIDESAQKGNNIIKDVDTALTLLETSGSGSYIEGRVGFVRLLKTLKVDQAFPDEYKAMEEFALDGILPSTETSIALAKGLTLGRAANWNQQLNNTEVGLLIDAGPQVALTKEGQRLLLEISKRNAEIDVEAKAMLDRLTIDENKSTLEAIRDVNKFKNEAYITFADSIKEDINKVLDYTSVRDLSFFEQQDPIQIAGEKVDLKEAYEKKQIKFAGYADEDGVFRLTTKSGTVIEKRVLKKGLPVYFYYDPNGEDIYALEGGTREMDYWLN